MKGRGKITFFARCFFLCCKHRLRRPAFWGCAAALLALAGGFLLLCPEPQGASAVIGLLFDPGDPALAAACASLTGEEGLPFRFYSPGEEEELRRAVLTGELHCGYLLDPGAKPPLTVYETDGSFLRPVADELLFGALFALEAPALSQRLAAGAGALPGTFSPGEAAPMRVVIESAAGGSVRPLLDLRPLLCAVLLSLFLFFSLFGGLFAPRENGVFAALAVPFPGAGSAAGLADALASAALQGLLLGALLCLPGLRGSVSAAAFLLLVAVAAALHQAAARLAGRFPRAVPPALLCGLCWALLSVLFSGALFDPTALGGPGALRFLSPAWLLAQLPF